jgi:hypothetical protein
MSKLFALFSKPQNALYLKLYFENVKS